jgi:hypothetical protein
MIRAAVDHLLPTTPHNTPFSIIAHPAFREANKVLDAFVKILRKTGKIAGVVQYKQPSRRSAIFSTAAMQRMSNLLSNFLAPHEAQNAVVPAEKENIGS